MKTQTYLKRVLSAFLVMVLASQVITLPVGARDKEEPVYLEEATMPEEILSADTFYVGTTSAELQENYGAPYVLKIGRGGDAAEKASVTLKITDMTASYGKDYKVSCQGKFFSKKANNPKDNESLLDIIAENEVLSETPLGTEEEQAEAAELAYAELGEMAAEAAEEADADVEAAGSDNPLRSAKEEVIGERSDRGTVTSSQEDMIDVLAQTANSITSIVQGATLEVDFAAGEAEKYVEITTVDNDESDGDRVFYITLSEPSEGYTNSMVSESIFTIMDDEPQEDAVVWFDQASYTTKGGALTVVVRREGAAAQTVMARLRTESGTARSGVEFSPVDAQVIFPFGVTERQLEIQTDNSYLQESAYFTLVLEPVAGTQIGEVGTATVTVQPAVQSAAAQERRSPRARGSAADKAESGEVYAQNVRLGNAVLGNAIPLNSNTVQFISGNGSYWFDNDWDWVHHDDPILHVFADTGLIAAKAFTFTYDPQTIVVKVALSGAKNSQNVDWGDQYVYMGFVCSVTTEIEGNSIEDRSTASLHLDPDYLDIPKSDLNAGIVGNGFISLNSAGSIGKAYYLLSRSVSDAVYIRCNCVLQQQWGENKKIGSAKINVEWIKPVKRPFLVSLLGADPMTYIGNGNITPQTKLIGYSEADGGAVHYDGDNIVLESDGNAFANLTGAQICLMQDGRVVRSAKIDDQFIRSDGGGMLNIAVTNEFIKTYKDFILLKEEWQKYHHGEYYQSWDFDYSSWNPDEIVLKPIYSYKTARLEIRPDETTIDDGSYAGTLYINNEAVDFGKPGSTSNNIVRNYHVGDRITFKTVTTSNNYTASGVEFKYTEASSGQDKDQIECYVDGSCSRELREQEYVLIPKFQQKDNTITLKIHKNDLDKFEHTGILSDENLRNSEITQTLGDYCLITLANTTYTLNGEDKELASGQVFRFAVTAKAGYQPVWKETNNANYYAAEEFVYTAKGERKLNVISLYAGVESSAYVAVRSRLFYENLFLSSLKGGIATVGLPVLPAEDGYISVLGHMAAPDTDGVLQTNAFHPVEKITVAGQEIVFGAANSDGTVRRLYSRITVAAGSVSETRDIELKIPGTNDHLEQVSNGSETVSACVTDLGNTAVGVNRAGSVRSNGAQVTYDNVVKSYVCMGEGRSKISVSVESASIPEGVNIREVNFLFYRFDGKTYRLNHTYRGIFDAEASKNDSYSEIYTLSKVFKDDHSEDDEYQEGDLVYAQIVTNECRLSSDQLTTIQKENGLTDEELEDYKTTAYPPLYTGFFLSKSGDLKEPPVQSLDMGTMRGLAGLPLIGNFNTNLNLGPVSLSVGELRDDNGKVVGTRLQAGLALDFAPTSLHSWNDKLPDNGIDYGSFFSKLRNIKSGFQSIASTFKETRDQAAANGKYSEAVKGMTTAGASKWGLVPIVGFYLDFMFYEVRDKTTNELLDYKLLCTGGGLFMGIQGHYSITWYAMIPVVFLPCYFGVSGQFTISANMGAATTVTHPEEDKVDGLTPEDLTESSGSYAEKLHFDMQVGVAARVQVYCGVGICGVLGVRGGATFDATFIMYPTLSLYNSAFDPLGFNMGVTVGLYIDLFLFAVPIETKLMNKNYGLLEQFEKYDKVDENGEQVQPTPEELDELKQTEKESGSKAAARMKNETTAGVRYELKPRDNTPSSWTGSVQAVSPGDVSSMATYKLRSVSTLLSDGYDRPDAQLIEMGDDGTLMVFLQDDKSRTDTERTALSYSVLQDGEYSEPVIIQTDGTGDFQPNVADAGDNVIITWISSDPAVDKGSLTDAGYETKYMKSLEIYSVSVPKADLAAHEVIDQSAIVRLTNDDFFDAQPYAVYDHTSGDYNVYYIKTAEDTESSAEAVDLANPMNTSGKTYSVIAYRVYENGKGWVTTEFKEKEKPSSMTDAQYTAQLAALGGQRLLSSPIRDEDIDKEDPLISDFHAIGYNGIGVFAYTIDKDMSADTDADRDLFIQLYDFATRSTYVPIRITDDDLPDAMPQLVRNGSDEDGTTYLFWMSDNKLQYIDVSTLVKLGVDENGQILEGDENENGYSLRIGEVNAFHDADNRHASYSDYQVAVDSEDNLYVIWIQTSSDGTEELNQEVYATAKIGAEIQGTDEEGDPLKNKSWADANQLTDFGLFCDEPALAIAEDGRMVMVFNRFDMDEDGLCTDMSLCSAVFEPYCSIEATGIDCSDKTPVEGQDVEVTVKFENTGLTASKNGFVADIFEKSASGATTLLETFDYDKSIAPTSKVWHTFTYTASANTPGSSIYVSVKEKDVQGVNNTDGDPFRLAPDYALTANNSRQNVDGAFYTDVTVTNTGNMKSKATDKLEVIFNGPYGSASNYGLTNEIFGSEALSLEPGESMSFKIKLDVPAEAFAKYGFIDVCTKAVDGKEEYVKANDSMYLMQPGALTINDGKDISLTEGDAIDIALNYATSDFLNRVNTMFVSADNSVVTVEDGKLIAVGGGTTTVTAYAMPYNAATSVTVTVKGTTPEIIEPDVEELTPLQVFFAKIKAVFEKFVLFLKQHFGPIFNTIKGWLRKIWEFLCRLVGVKVNAN